MQKEIIHNLRWYTDSELRPEHRDFPVRQVTCFVITKDDKLLLVSKNGEKWSVTAGHYEAQKDPDFTQTAIREVYEESGLDISKYAEGIKRLGYYVVQDVEKESKNVLDTYIQIRMLLVLDLHSKEISLKPTEKDLVKHAQFFDIKKSMELIKWLRDSGEWKAIKKITKKYESNL